MARWMGTALAAAMLLAPMALPAGAQTRGAVSYAPRKVAVTIHNATGDHVFQAEIAASVDAQERGLMYRTNIPKDGGMLFAPYPPKGGPKVANFWMKNTPSALDIIFIARDGTIDAIAANAEPFSETVLSSAHPVSAVLEINAGRAAELGIVVGDRVSWKAK